MRISVQNVVILIALGILPVSTLCSAEHSGWKTLKNSHGWSIQYPPDWVVYCEGFDCSTETDAEVFFEGPVIRSADKKGSGFKPVLIGISRPGGACRTVDPISFCLERKRRSISGTFNIYSEKEIQLFGFKSYEFLGCKSEAEASKPNSWPSCIRQLIIGLGGEAQSVQIYESPEPPSKKPYTSVSEWKYGTIVEQILSTLKVAKPSSNKTSMKNTQTK